MFNIYVCLMTTTERIFWGAVCFVALSSQAATYDFTAGTASTNGWQPYLPLAPFGVAYTFSDDASGYRLQSAPSVNPALLGPARVGSFLPGSIGDFALSYDVPSYSSSLSEFFGGAARIGTVGLGTSSGYVLGYDTSVGELFISKVVNESSVGAIGPGATAPVALTPGQGYRFTFEGVGANFDGAVYSLNNLTTPLTTVAGTDSQFSSGEVGLLVASQAAAGAADETFSRFTVIPEPSAAALAVLGGLMILGASWRRHARR